MAESSIPVDLLNPGQVFACLGFLEVADVLLGDAEAGFDWSNPDGARFRLSAHGNDCPVDAVLGFTASATVEKVVPPGYIDSPAKDAEEDEEEGNAAGGSSATTRSDTFPAREADPRSLPVQITAPSRATLSVSHWSDGSTRNTFKLYSGNRPAERIAWSMLQGVREKPKKGGPDTGQTQKIGDLKYKGIAQLWCEQKDALKAKPFDVLTAMGGSFNFDPRGAWTALDAGYSPNTQKHAVSASPVVHLLAACALEHMRPPEHRVREVRYAVWSGLLAPMLARVALQGRIPSLPMKHFRFELAMSGKNKIVTFAKQETSE